MQFKWSKDYGKIHDASNYDVTYRKLAFFPSVVRNKLLEQFIPANSHGIRKIARWRKFGGETAASVRLKAGNSKRTAKSKRETGFGKTRNSRSRLALGLLQSIFNLREPPPPVGGPWCVCSCANTRKSWCLGVENPCNNCRCGSAPRNSSISRNCVSLHLRRMYPPTHIFKIKSAESVRINLKNTFFSTENQNTEQFTRIVIKTRARASIFFTVFSKLASNTLSACHRQ